MENATDDCLKASPLPEQRIYGSIMLATSISALLFYLFLLESIYIFARRRVAVMLLLSHSFAELFMLIQFVWLSIEIIANFRIRLPYHLDSFLYKFANYAEQAHLLLIAFNRAHCIYSPTHYKALWSQRNAKIACGLAWFYGAGLSIFLNYGLEKPEETYLIHCVARFTFDRIRVNQSAEIAHEMIGRYSTMVLVFFPLAIYCFFLMQIACECICPRVSELAVILHQRTRKFTRGAKLSDEVATLGDRIRLLLICLLSTLPDAIVWLTMASLGKDLPYKKFMQSMLIILMHCNQPVWLILLSATFRVHLRGEIDDLLDGLQNLLNWLNPMRSRNKNNNENGGNGDQLENNVKICRFRQNSHGRRRHRRHQHRYDRNSNFLESKGESAASRRGSGQQPQMSTVSIFTLTNENGQMDGNADLDGKIKEMEVTNSEVIIRPQSNGMGASSNGECKSEESENIGENGHI